MVKRITILFTFLFCIFTKDIDAMENPSKTFTLLCLNPEIADAGLLIEIQEQTEGGQEKRIFANISEQTFAGPRFLERKILQKKVSQTPQGNTHVYEAQQFQLQISVPKERAGTSPLIYPALFNGTFPGAYFENGLYKDLELKCSLI